MASKTRDENEPDWVNPANDRKTPYADAELDRLASDFEHDRALFLVADRLSLATPDILSFPWRDAGGQTHALV